jgi:hypothetical protein
MATQVPNRMIAFDGGNFAFRNNVINGNFDIWQRRTTYTGNIIAPIIYPAADRWRVYAGVPSTNNPVGTYTVARRGSLAVELQRFQANYYQRLTTNITTFGTTEMNRYYGNASITPGIQNIENAVDILGKTMTVSFWARASTANCKLLSESQIFSNNSSSGTDFWTPTICKVLTVGTAWQKFTHTYTMPTYGTVVATAYNPSGKNVETPTYTPIGSSNMPPLKDWLYQVDFKTMWSRGSNNQHGNHPNRPAGYPDPLSESDFQALLTSAEARKDGGWIDIAQVQLEEGSSATPFEQRPIGTELALCQRYYCKTYDLNTPPGTAGTGQGAIWAHTDEPTSPTIHNIGWSFPVSMRVRPECTAYSPGTGAIDRVYTNTDGDLPVASIAKNTNRISYVNLDPSLPREFRQFAVHYTADAEIY